MLTCFVIMPFTDRLDPVYKAVQQVCEQANIHTVRADEIQHPGSVIDQIFEAITTCHLVIAEISDRNPNVFYEVGVAHALNKPTVLLATKDSIKNLPFDVRHNRVLVYSETSGLESSLPGYLENVRKTLGSERSLSTVSATKGGTDAVVQSVGRRFDLVGPQLKEQRPVETGIAITIEDALGQQVTAIMDLNGFVTHLRRR